MTKNDCDGIMGKSKQVAICAPSCSAAQVKDPMLRTYTFSYQIAVGSESTN